MSQSARSHRSFTRIGLGVIAGLLSLASATSSAEVFNQQWGFAIAYPDGWSVEQFQQGPLVAQGVPPGETLVNCNTTAGTVPETKNLSQEDINAQITTDVMNEKFWRSAVYNRVQNVQIESSSVRQHPSGIKVPEAFAAYDQAHEGVTVHGKARTTIFITPGVTYSITCNAVSDRFNTYRTDFAAVVESFRLRSDIVAMLSARRPGPRLQGRLDLSQATLNAPIGVNTRRAFRR